MTGSLSSLPMKSMRSQCSDVISIIDKFSTYIIRCEGITVHSSNECGQEFPQAEYVYICAMDQQTNQVYCVDNKRKCIIVSNVDGLIIRTINIAHHDYFIRNVLIHNGHLYVTAYNKPFVAVFDTKDGRHLRGILPGYIWNDNIEAIHIAFFDDLLYITNSRRMIFTYSPLSCEIKLFKDFSKLKNQQNQMPERVYNMSFSPMGVPHYSNFFGIAVENKSTMADSVTELKPEFLEIKIPMPYGHPPGYVIFSGEVGSCSETGFIYLIDEQENLIYVYNYKYELNGFLPQSTSILSSLQILNNGQLLIGSKDGFYIIK